MDTSFKAKDLLALLLTLTPKELEYPVACAVEDLVVSGPVLDFRIVKEDLFWDDSNSELTCLKSRKTLRNEGFVENYIAELELGISGKSFTIFM